MNATTRFVLRGAATVAGAVACALALGLVTGAIAAPASASASPEFAHHDVQHRFDAPALGRGAAVDWRYPVVDGGDAAARRPLNDWLRRTAIAQAACADAEFLDRLVAMDDAALVALWRDGADFGCAHDRVDVSLVAASGHYVIVKVDSRWLEAPDRPRRGVELALWDLQRRQPVDPATLVDDDDDVDDLVDALRARGSFAGALRANTGSAVQVHLHVHVAPVEARPVQARHVEFPG